MVLLCRVLGLKPYSFTLNYTNKIVRLIHSSFVHQDVNKTLLGTLRKKTGFKIAICRKALDMHNNDLVKAEEWLQSQAQALGWQMAEKVKNRQASQGLIGIAVNNKKVAMVEVNCETDFASRNDKFRSMVELVATTCLEVPILTDEANTKKVHLNSKEIGSLVANNTSLFDHLTLLIGSMGENMLLRRAFCFETNRDDIDIAVGIHPPTGYSKVLLGKYGSFLSFQRNLEFQTDKCENVGDNLCKHIIGMNPVKIGDFENDKPEDESALINQTYLLDDSLTVGQYLAESGIKILDFVRFECGESGIENNEVSSSEETISVNG